MRPTWYAWHLLAENWIGYHFLVCRKAIFEESHAGTEVQNAIAIVEYYICIETNLNTVE